MDFVNDNDNPKLSAMMKPVENIVTAPEGTNCKEAYKIMKLKKVTCPHMHVYILYLHV